MRFIVAGDTHMDLAHCQYIVKTARMMGYDRIFILGDFGYWEHMSRGFQFLNKLNTYANILNVQVYFLDGNHDKTSMILEKYGDADYRDHEGFILIRPYIRYAPRGHRWTWDECRFAAFGGAYSVDKKLRLDEEKASSYEPGTLWFPEEEMSDHDMDEFLKDQVPVDVIFAHDKPRAANPGPGFDGYVLCLPNQDRLQRALVTLRPKFFYHGHLHHAYEDYVRYNGPYPTRVIGLDCNQSRGDSWRLFDTEVPVGVSA